MIEPGELHAIAARAETLDEALARGGASDAAADPARAAARRDDWRRALGGDTAAFRRRLAWDGLDEDRVLAAFGTLRSPATPLPAWTALLVEAISCAPEVAALVEKDETPAELEGLPPERVPRFAEVWVPFARAADARLGRAAEASLARFSPSARRAMTHALLTELGDAGQLALGQLFDLHRDASGGSPIPSVPPARRLYRAFVGGLLGGGLAPLFGELSALARVASTLALDWVDANAELAARVAADDADLARVFGASGEVAGLAPALSDRHEGGRSVAILEFASGSRVVYKPRTVALEAAWSDVLAWLAPHVPDAPPRLAVVARDGYGWIEHAPAPELTSKDDAARFFRQGGALLATAWVLGARDLTMDNLLATTAGPLVIDAEAILQPELALGVSAPRNALASAGARLERTFIATGLLTSQVALPDGRLVEVGGLLGTGGHRSSAKARVFRHANSDAMTVSMEATSAAPMPNLPAVDGRRLTARDFAGDVSAGFTAAYRAIASLKDELLELVARRSADETRIVPRATDQYARLLAVLSSPPYLSEGVARSFAIDSLTRIFGAARSRPALFPLVADERAALERGDVPVFRVPVGATALVSRAGERIDGVVASSGLDALRARLARMNADDLADQSRLLAALLARGGDEPALAAGDASEPLEAAPAVASDELLRRALAIGDELLAAGIRGDDGSLTWIAPSHLQGASRADRGVSWYVYDGALGIALFLAGLGRAAGRPDLLRASWDACRPLASALTAPDAARVLANEGLGAGNGLGSLVWGLLAVGRALSQELPAITLARRAASHVTPARVAADEILDVEGGAAGAILGLLALHDATGDRDVLAAALACGDHLLRKADDLGDGRLAWRAPGGAHLAGMAHGAAGIALALARLHAATGWDELPPAIAGALRFEASLFDDARGNWPVIVKDEDGGERRGFMLAWCNGAPGIALARLAMPGAAGSEAAWDDVVRAVGATKRAGLLPLDHLCCGNAGLVEALVLAGGRLGAPDLVTRAHERVAAMVRRADLAGGFRFRVSEAENACFQPGLFRGVAGIGATLLRLARPGALPNVLVFESPMRETT